jgi:hypothetical protein
MRSWGEQYSDNVAAVERLVTAKTDRYLLWHFKFIRLPAWRSPILHIGWLGRAA